MPSPIPLPPPNPFHNVHNTAAETSATASSSSFAHATPSASTLPPGSSLLRLDVSPIHVESSRALPTSAEGDIEMTPISPASGHRRRRSSLMSPINSNGVSYGPRTSRPRGQSLLGQSGVPEEPKVIEGVPNSRLPASEDEDDDSLSDEDLHDDEEAGLTRKDRRRKQNKRRRNTQLDNRIAKDGITAEEKREADKNVLRRLLVNGTLILLWYLFSLSLSLYNKWMFDSSRLNFPFPMFTTAVHMLVQFSLACLVLYFIPSLRPQSGHKSDLGQSRHEPERPIMTKMFYLTRIGPCGAATGLDIGLGNTSLKFITLTFYTMCKSSSLAFVLLFAFVFRLESPTWRLVAIIATMTAGVVMMVAGEVEFKLGGFVLVISAAFFSGFRWGLTQILLLRNPATSNPFSSIFFLAPVMFVTLLSIAIPVEGFAPLLAGLGALVDEWGALLTPLLILFPGTIAFLMTASEFALLQRTSVVTLSIAGIFKEVVTISTATLVFDDKLTPINFSGLVITIAAICAYNYLKITKMRQDAQLDVHRGHLQSDAGSADLFSSLSSSPSGGSDAENDLDGNGSGSGSGITAEEVGLLRKSADLQDDILSRSPVGAEGRLEPQHRSERED